MTTSTSVIEHPIVTEKAMDEMDFENKLQFLVDLDAAKPEVREEVEDRYEVTVESVNTQVTPNGTKKATVRLSEDDDAQEIASRIGVF
ncbi:MAG: 50S ribosomal protein L23 [Haloferacaceae archaeon]